MEHSYDFFMPRITKDEHSIKIPKRELGNYNRPLTEADDIRLNSFYLLACGGKYND